MLAFDKKIGNRFSFMLVSGFLLMLTACGGGGSSTSSSTPATSGSSSSSSSGSSSSSSSSSSSGGVAVQSPVQTALINQYTALGISPTVSTSVSVASYTPATGDVTGYTQTEYNSTYVMTLNTDKSDSTKQVFDGTLSNSYGTVDYIRDTYTLDASGNTVFTEQANPKGTPITDSTTLLTNQTNVYKLSGNKLLKYASDGITLLSTITRLTANSLTESFVGGNVYTISNVTYTVK